MAWGEKTKSNRTSTPTVKKTETIPGEADEVVARAKSSFIPATELEQDDGLKIAVLAKSKQGKTALTQAKTKLPRYCIDTEGNIKKEVRNYVSRPHTPEEAAQTHVAEVLKMSDIIDKKGKKKIDLVASLDAAFTAIDEITEIVQNTPHVKGEPAPGTIVVDSATDIWDWTKMWLEDGADGTLKRNKTTGEIPRFEWGKANEKYTNFIHMILHSDWHVIMTFRAKPAVNEKGEDLGFNVADWQKYTDFWFDVICELKWTGTASELTFRGDRYGNIQDKIYDPDWEKICAKIEEHSGLKVL
jgi:hypothetical protein